MGGAPKFPSSSSHDLLARAGRFPFGEPAREMFDAWAWGMSEGGIYDHLGGGFSRYSVDQQWMIPHFEKMLYDNGPLLRLCADAWLITADTLFARVCEQTAGWVMREMQAPEGGYYQSGNSSSFTLRSCLRGARPTTQWGRGSRTSCMPGEAARSGGHW